MTTKAIHPRISVNPISSWTWTLEQDLAFYEMAGIKVTNPCFLKFRDDVEAGIAAIKGAGLISCSLAGGGTECLIESEETTLAGLKPYIDAAHALDSPSIYVVTGPTPPRMPTEDACAAFAACMGQANRYAAERGVRIAIENNSVTTRDTGFVHTLAVAVDVARAADVGICLELQNCWYEPGLPRLFRDNVDLFTVAQVSDFLIGEPAKFNRRVPGDGTAPLEWMLGHLLDAGFAGYFDVELLGPAIEAEGYPAAIHRSIDWLSERFARWGV
jgi:sugar phosphate isomerase/epimerase